MQQLSQLKKQLDEELTHLTNSFTQLRAAQARFRDCLASLAKGLADRNAGRTILVPLTASLYVPGTLADAEHVLVDVGTGFYVEKGRDDARAFYEGKVKELQANLEKLEAVVRQKSESLRVIEEGVYIVGQGARQDGLLTLDRAASEDTTITRKWRRDRRCCMINGQIEVAR